MNIRALSLIRPWGTLIATGKKPIEWRSWQTNYRGIVLLHTSGSTTSDNEMKKWKLLPEDCPLKAIIGAATIVGCEWNYQHQQYAHICETPILFAEPILCVPGALNYWQPRNERQQKGFDLAIAQLKQLKQLA